MFVRLAVADDESGVRDVFCDSPSAACSECCTSQEATGFVGYCLRIPRSGFCRRAVRSPAALHAVDGKRDLPKTSTHVDHETQLREVPSARLSGDVTAASVAVSMSKLFDLMVMVCKFYTLHCTEASLLLQVRSAVFFLLERFGAKLTLRHLSEVSKLLEQSEEIARIEALRERLFEAYRGLSSWRWYILWSEMLSPSKCIKICRLYSECNFRILPGQSSEGLCPDSIESPESKRQNCATPYQLAFSNTLTGAVTLTGSRRYDPEACDRDVSGFFVGKPFREGEVWYSVYRKR